MTTQHDQTGAAAGTAPDTGESSVSRMADTAKTEASNVASTATGGAHDVASEASTQAKAVAGEAKQQFDQLVSQSREELRQQAEQRTSQAAGQLRTLSQQFTALVEGRPEAAGPLVGYVNELQGQVRALASRMEQGGPQGVVDDVTRFARRRPGTFLAGAAGIGFVVGRLVRAGAASQQSDGPSSDAMPMPSNGPELAGQNPLPPPLRSAGTAP